MTAIWQVESGPGVQAYDDDPEVDLLAAEFAAVRREAIEAAAKIAALYFDGKPAAEAIRRAASTDRGSE